LTLYTQWCYYYGMINLNDLTTSQLKRVIAIKKRIEKLQGKLESIAGDSGGRAVPVKGKRRRLSAAARARIAAGARARWARVKGKAAGVKRARKGKRRLSAAGRAAIIAATKARWARVKGTAAPAKAAKKRDRRTSPEVRARLAAIARARWAKVRAAGQTKL
jgi:hypothetical protein